MLWPSKEWFSKERLSKELLGKKTLPFVLGAVSLFSFVACGNVSTATDLSENEILISSQAEFNDSVEGLRPGDTLVLANGVWENFEILFSGAGTEKSPITLRAQEKGEVVISGESNLRMAGEYLVVSGLVFKNGYTPTDSVISFRRNSSDLAYHSRVTETVIDNFSNPERTETDYWVSVFGKHNRFDHNHLEGKRNNGVTMAVRLNTEESRENHHRIDHNYFGPRSILGSNGGETLRIGTSHYSLSDSFTVVENNYFDRANGELEIISNKSGGNTFKGNVFFESRGTLTMRHGNNNLVENNVFFGNGADHTGGIRVINAGQTIRNNYMEGLAGYRFGGALVVMNGVPNSPINRYHQVADAVITGNTLVNSDHIQLGAGSDEERSAVPINSEFKNNLIYNEDGAEVFTVYDDMSGIEFASNIQNGTVTQNLSSGFSARELTMVRAENGLMYPTNAPDGVGINKDFNPIKKSETGASWYPKSEAGPIFGTGKDIVVEPGVDTIAVALKTAEAGDRLILADGEYTVARVLELTTPVSIIGNGKDSALVRYERTALFEIQAGGALEISGLTITGESSPDNAGNAVIRTQRNSMLENYQVLISDVKVVDLNINHTFNFINVSKSTMADRIEIKDSDFSNITGYILKLDAETDDYGIYNSEYVDIQGSSFTNVEGALVAYYRGGTDESTFGPHFLLTDSKLDNVGAGRRNKYKTPIYLHGVQVSTINDNQISNSPAIRFMHTVGEPVSRVFDNTFVNTAAPTVVEMNSDEENTAKIYDNSYSTSEK